MFSVLIAAVIASITISFLCSLLEAALYAIPLPHVKHLAETGSRAGRILLKHQLDIGKPIAAILVLNTVSHTAGAAVAGASAGVLWGESGLLLFSILYTLAILFFSEILPKVLGVTYCKQVSRVAALPLEFLVRVLYPFVWVSQLVSKRIQAGESATKISEEEVLSMAAMGTEQGALQHFEGSVISNVIALEETLVRDVLTPRTSVFKMPEDTCLSKLEGEVNEWQHSRVPIYGEDEPDHLVGYVNQRDIYRSLLSGKGELTLKEISRELLVVPELMTADKLLQQMFEHKDHIASVVDEHGALAGVITMEDVLEELVGTEIVDEYDQE